MAINSEENVLASTVFYLLLYHNIGARFRNITQPVCNFLVSLFAACDASTKPVDTTGLPLGAGILCDSSSFSLSIMNIDNHEGGGWGESEWLV